MPPIGYWRMGGKRGESGEFRLLSKMHRNLELIALELRPNRDCCSRLVVGLPRNPFAPIESPPAVHDQRPCFDGLVGCPPGRDGPPLPVSLAVITRGMGNSTVDAKPIGEAEMA